MQSSSASLFSNGALSRPKSNILDALPDVLLFELADWLLQQDLLNLTQISKRYRRVLRAESDKRRYDTMYVQTAYGNDTECLDDDETDDDELDGWNEHINSCTIGTLMIHPELIRLMRLYCKTIFVMPACNLVWAPKKHAKVESEYILTVSYLFRGSSVESVSGEFSTLSNIGFEFPITDRRRVDYWDLLSGEGRWSREFDEYLTIGPYPVDLTVEAAFVGLCAGCSAILNFTVFTAFSESKAPFLRTLRKVFDDDTKRVNLMWKSTQRTASYRRIGLRRRGLPWPSLEDGVLVTHQTHGYSGRCRSVVSW